MDNVKRYAVVGVLCMGTLAMSSCYQEEESPFLYYCDDPHNELDPACFNYYYCEGYGCKNENSCFSDRDCTTGFYCNKDSARSRFGVCEERETDVEEAPNRCTDNDDCREGWECNNRNRCVPREEEEGCQSDQDCDTGERCDNSECVAKTTPCQSNSDCPSGDECNEERQVCEPDDGVCESDDDCRAQERCNEDSGACVPIRCSDFNEDEAGCIDWNGCQGVYSSNNCSSPNGQRCSARDTNCVCQGPFVFTACVDEVQGSI